MKDINLPSPDKYDTSEIVMFLSQVVMHNSFYDDDLEFVQLEHVQIVSSMAPASTLGRHPLATRMTANLRVWAISYPSRNKLLILQVVVMAGLSIVSGPQIIDGEITPETFTDFCVFTITLLVASRQSLSSAAGEQEVGWSRYLV